MLLERFGHEMRLLGKTVWLTPPFTMLGFALLLGILNRSVEPTVIARSIGGGLEILLPIAAGVVMATIATHDRALELQLTMPRLYQRTTGLRFAFIVLWSSIVALLTSFALALLHCWRMPTQLVSWTEPWQFLVWQLNWLAPLLGLMTLGMLQSLLLRSRSASGAILCVLAFAVIMFHDSFDSVSFLHPLYLFPLTFTPGAPYWLASRLELLAFAGGLFLLAWLLLKSPELLLSHTTGEE